MAQVSDDLLKRQGKSNFPASKKIYKTGSRPDIKVPFRVPAGRPVQSGHGPGDR